MRVGVDLDGVCYDFDGALKHHLVNNRGFAVERCTPVVRWELYEDWGMTFDEFVAECAAGVEAGILFTHGAAFPGTRDALQRLVDFGHTLHVITDRTWGKSGLAEAATRAWTNQELPPLSSLTFAGDKTVVRTDFMIEDKISNYDALIASGCDAWLINRPWNQVPGDNRRRVDTLDEFVDHVLAASVVHV